MPSRPLTLAHSQTELCSCCFWSCYQSSCASSAAAPNQPADYLCPSRPLTAFKLCNPHPRLPLSAPPSVRPLHTSLHHQQQHTFLASLPVLPSSMADRMGLLGLRGFARFLALAGLLAFTPDVPSSLLSPPSPDSPPDCPDSSASIAEPSAAARLRLLPAACCCVGFDLQRISAASTDGVIRRGNECVTVCCRPDLPCCWWWATPE